MLTDPNTATKEREIDHHSGPEQEPACLCVVLLAAQNNCFAELSCKANTKRVRKNIHKYIVYFNPLWSKYFRQIQFLKKGPRALSSMKYSFFHLLPAIKLKE